MTSDELKGRSEPLVSSMTESRATSAHIPPLRSVSPTDLTFEGPTLNPVPTPQFATPPDLDVWSFLEFVEPIPEINMLAFQVAQMTVGMAELKRRLEAIENGP